ncbi:YwaF family protein [Microlunatus elymi]|uniref:YwaF family protein n=1 Tax=Microlunatus elymi TaxID=2596828 RepID=UPI001AEFF0E3|nr:TIGR02206 family membrane protein [Microlunatus elymi]
MDIIGESFTPYGFGHWLMLAITVVGAVALVLAGRRLRDRPASTIIARTLALVLAVAATIHLIVGLVPANFRVGASLPLQFSDALRFIAAGALWFRWRWALVITYYWGLTFNPWSLVTPNLDYVIAPWYDFTAYWALHILVMWAPIYLVWGQGWRPDWRSYRLGIVFTLIWSAMTLGLNFLLGTNYGFLNRKPAAATPLDLMGPWPIYLFVCFVLMFIIWALITWPWTIRRRTEPPGKARPPETLASHG